MLIAFEGLDQSGKETQARRLRERLEACGRRVLALSFPDYTTPIGAEIGRALAGEREYPPEVLQLLYVANRYEYRDRILDTLHQGGVVVADRYLASSVAYGEAHGLDGAWLFEIQRHLPQPDLTILLDIDPSEAARRKAANRDRFERDLDLLARVRASYLAQAGRGGWLVIDGARSRDEVAAAIVSAAGARLGLPSEP